jgi:Sel1 repeat
MTDRDTLPAKTPFGVMYDHGRGLPQDYAAAANWYREAGDQGVAPTQFNLGLMYDQGRGVPQDYAAAAAHREHRPGHRHAGRARAAPHAHNIPNPESGHF